MGSPVKAHLGEASWTRRTWFWRLRFHIRDARQLPSVRFASLSHGTGDVLDVFAVTGNVFSGELGARPIQRIIEKDIINRLSVDIITGNVVPGDAVTVEVKDGNYIFTKKSQG